ncbi:hypothetical protein KJ682_11435 [bacterium]|nr:hypothetical protein [bacterium]
MALMVEISVGELLDKITILEIKSERITDPAKLANVRTELQALRDTWAASPLSQGDIAGPLGRLKAVNEKLWDIEDGIRDLEAAGDFGERFIALARSVYFSNDERAAIKRELNRMLGSRLVEEKSYTDYGRPR